MRVLIVPELYRPWDASANATLNDAVTWVEEWLDIDDTLHVYWLLPPRSRADYEREYVLADRERVTLIEAERFMADAADGFLFNESGYSEAQFEAIQRHIYDELGYVDVVVDQLRTGRKDLYKWLLHLAGHRVEDPLPFSMIVNVHDLMLPFKYPTDGYRTDYHRRLEIVEALFVESRWFKARLDAQELPVYAREFLRPDVVSEGMSDAVLTDSPIDFSQFEETYRDAPRWLHVAGSGWEKKRPEIVMEIAEMLHERYDIRTVMTSMNQIPEHYRELPWVEAHPEASRPLYERILRRGDLAICASEYDTLARTWFEQAASGQVLLLRDAPWIYDCVPADCELVAPVDELGELAAWTVENWDAAVEENRRLVEYVRRVRDPAHTGRETYEDMAMRTAKKVDGYVGPERKTVRKAVRRLDVDRISLAELDERGARYAPDGQPLLEHRWCGISDLVFTLRQGGFEDVGNGGTPEFRRVETE